MKKSKAMILRRLIKKFLKEALPKDLGSSNNSSSLWMRKKKVMVILQLTV